MKSRVLVVDDSEIETMALKAVLEERSYEVTVAHDGIEAMELIRHPSNEFEIIILDWLMPGIDGVQLCINIRQMSLAINPFIMILTSNEWHGAEYTALTCGADDFLEKPFDSDKLCARLLLADRIVGYQRKIVELSKSASTGSVTAALQA
jgi:DNA-binding response OmpR family regulator